MEKLRLNELWISNSWTKELWTHIFLTHILYFFHILFCSKKFVAYDCFVFNYSAILNMNLNIYENIYYVRIYNVKTYINIY